MAKSTTTPFETDSTPLVGNPFLRALAFTLKWEGGFVHDPADPGGATLHGVTQKVYTNYRHKLNRIIQSVRFMTEEEMHDIYFHNYWLVIGCQDMPKNLALVQFDFGVNAGPRRAIEMIQHATGASVDGQYGPITQAHITDHLQSVTEPKFCADLIQARRDYYAGLVEARPSLRKFKHGWDNRVDALEIYIQHNP